MKFTVEEIARVIDGKVEGNPKAVISKFSKIEAGEEEGLSFLANAKYTHYIYETKATAVLVSNDFVPTKEVPCTLIRIDDPYLAFAKLMTFYQQKTEKVGISKFAAIAEDAQIGKNISALLYRRSTKNRQQHYIESGCENSSRMPYRQQLYHACGCHYRSRRIWICPSKRQSIYEDTSIGQCCYRRQC